MKLHVTDASVLSINCHKKVDEKYSGVKRGVQQIGIAKDKRQISPEKQ